MKVQVNVSFCAKVGTGNMSAFALENEGGTLGAYTDKESFSMKTSAVYAKQTQKLFTG